MKPLWSMGGVLYAVRGVRAIRTILAIGSMQATPIMQPIWVLDGSFS